MRKNQGFTLIELMIVVAIIAIIVAIAVPNLIRARLQSNEASAIENLRTICSAQITYHTANSTYGTFDQLTDGGASEPFLPENWEEGLNKSGYIFSMPTVDDADFECFADPRTVDKSGKRYFRVDASGIIRYALGGRPDAASEPVE